MNKWCQKEIDQMILLISKTKNPEELRAVFELILTPREINDMARRLVALSMLQEGRNYTDISMELGLGPSTISRISSGIGFGFRRCGMSSLTKKEPPGLEIKIVRSNTKCKGASTYRLSISRVL